MIELLSVVMKAQEERTLTYVKYDKDLELVIKSKNMQRYVAVVANVTANFLTQSNLINSAKKCLIEIHNLRDIAKNISALQLHEKEKLNLTAALHLERLRESENKGDRLLVEGIKSLRSKINRLIDQINEIIDELKYELMELSC